MAPKKEEKSAFRKILDNLKIKYLNGKNPIGRTQTGFGFSPSSNAALNIGRLLNVPYDRELRIRKGDPQKELRAFNSRIGQIERIHNTYLNPIIKLAD